MSATASPMLYPGESPELKTLLRSQPPGLLRSDANCLLDSALALAERLAEKPDGRIHFAMLYLLRQAAAMHEAAKDLT